MNDVDYKDVTLMQIDNKEVIMNLIWSLYFP